jgi:hypothetical protein
VAVVVDPQGVGTQLKRLIRRLGLPDVKGCGCEAAAREMDELGPDSCERAIDRLADKLRKNADKIGWLDKAKAAASNPAAWAELALTVDWDDPYAGLVREAVRLERERLRASRPPGSP